MTAPPFLPPDLKSLSPAAQREIFNRVCRRSLLAFCQAAYAMLYPGKRLEPSLYIQAMVYELERIALGKTKRLINNIPPRHGKSDFGTCMLAAWMLGRDPSTKVFVICYGMGLSTGFARKVRQILKHPLYKRIFPHTRIKFGEDRSDHFMTTAGGEFRAGSQDGMITGAGTNTMILDDFQKADAALSPVERENAILTFRNSLVSRFDNLADGRILINQQRLHPLDISGFALGLGNWDHFKLAAIAEEDQKLPLGNGRFWFRKKGEVLDPVRADLAYWEELRLLQGPESFAAQAQQAPLLGRGGIIDWLWFGQYDELPPRGEFLKIVQSWDPAIKEAATADFSVGMTWGLHRDGRWYLLDLFRRQIGFTPLFEQIVASARQWRVDAMIIEGTSVGISLWQEVKRLGIVEYAIAPTPRGTKEYRMIGRSAQLATGNYLLPKDAPWLATLKAECIAFPSGHDDQVDALSQFLDFVFQKDRWLHQRRDKRGYRYDMRDASTTSGSHNAFGRR